MQSLRILLHPKQERIPALQQDLQRAILQNSIEGVKLSLRTGADVEYVYKDKVRGHYTPLILAINQGNLAIIKLLLKKANVNHVVKQSNFHINSPLSAAFCNDTDNGLTIFDLLVQDDVTMHDRVPGVWLLGPCVTDDELKKATIFLHRLFKNGMNQETLLAKCKQLKAIGMDFSKSNNLMVDLIKNDYVDVIDYILKHIPYTVSERFFIQNYNAGIRSNFWFVTIYDKSEHVNPGGHLSLLMMTIYNRQHEIMHRLIDAGACIYQRSLSTATIPNETPITLAIKINNTEAINTLLKHYEAFAVDNSNKDGETPLLCAVMVGRKDLAKHFLHLGANVNKCDKKHRLPLEIAIKRHDVPMVQLLIKNGADIKLRTSTNETFSDYVASKGTGEIAELLGFSDCVVASKPDNKMRMRR